MKVIWQQSVVAVTFNPHTYRHTHQLQNDGCCTKFMRALGVAAAAVALGTLAAWGYV